MLKSTKLTSVELEQVGRGLGKLLAHPLSTPFLARSRTLNRPMQFALAECFELWVVDADALSDSLEGVDLRNVARQTARVHHQILVNGRVIGYARSLLVKGKRTLNAVSFSTVGAQVNRIIDDLDSSLDKKAEVRMLMIPKLRLMALWIVPGSSRHASQVRVVNAPRSVRIPRRSIVNSAEFFNAVRASFARDDSNHQGLNHAS